MIDIKDTSHYDRHRVSCKIILTNPESTKILLTKYHNGTYGLPGGHIDGNEHPDAALMRELKEEIGIKYTSSLNHVDFFRTNRGKIVLLYRGNLQDTTRLYAPDGEDHTPFWASLDDILEGLVSVGEYDKFIIAHTTK